MAESESSLHRMLPFVTAIAVAMMSAVLVAFVVLEQERGGAVADRDIIEAATSLNSASKRFEEMLQLMEKLDTLSADNSRLREQVEFLREKIDFLESKLKAAEEQGFKISPDDE